MTVIPKPPEPFALPYPLARAEWALGIIGWPKRELARRIHTDEGSVRQMLRGVRPLPDVLGIWLETLARFHAAHPEPYTWRPKGYRPDSSNQEPAPSAAATGTPLGTDSVRTSVRTCRECGCTDADCSDCVRRTGSPCDWVEADLCSACAPEEQLPAGLLKTYPPVGVQPGLERPPPQPAAPPRPTPADPYAGMVG